VRFYNDCHSCELALIVRSVDVIPLTSLDSSGHVLNVVISAILGGGLRSCYDSVVFA
jgi:hypothetical protein